MMSLNASNQRATYERRRCTFRALPPPLEDVKPHGSMARDTSQLHQFQEHVRTKCNATASAPRKYLIS